MIEEKIKAGKQPMNAIKQKLSVYVSLKTENENRLERLIRLKNDAKIPAIKQGDGSQHTSDGNGRMERAIIRAMEYEEKIRPQIKENEREMAEIESAISDLSDPMEREILRLRYIDCDGCRLMPWKDVALHLFGDNDERHILAAYRLHGRALVSISEFFTKKSEENDRF